MIHLEGAVVESFYDIFLYSWHHKMTPLLPCIVDPPQNKRDHTATASDFQFQDQNPYLNDIELVKAAKAARKMLQLEKNDDDRLAKLRSDAEKEGIFGGYGGRFQAALGAIAESRRGSFSADTRDQELLRDADGTGAPHAQRGGPVKFADAVFKAMDAKRKGFGFGASRAEDHTAVTTTAGNLDQPALHEASEQQASKPNPRPSTAEEPSLVNWNDNSHAPEGLQREMSELDSPTRAKANAGDAQAFAAESQYRNTLNSSSSSHQQNGEQTLFLPALDLPGSSLRTPTDEMPAEAGSHAVANGNTALTAHPERESAAHPGMTTASREGELESTSAQSNDHASTSVNGSHSGAIPMRVKDYAVSESASADTTPALAYSQYTEPSSKGPDTPPATSAGPVHPSAFPGSSTSTSNQAEASTSKGTTAPSPSNTRLLFSHILDPSGKPLTTFKFSSFAERRNMNISTGSSSAGSKPPPKKNWIEGRKLRPGYSFDRWLTIPFLLRVKSSSERVPKPDLRYHHHQFRHLVSVRYRMLSTLEHCRQHGQRWMTQIYLTSSTRIRYMQLMTHSPSLW